MCGRYVLSSSGEQLSEHFNVPLPSWYRASFNMAPSQSVPVFHYQGREAVFSKMTWGLTPSWAKKNVGPRGGVRLPTFINARSETAWEKASFRNAFRYGRVLVPGTAFYEWKNDPEGSKQAHAVQLKNGQLFAMAGLWEAWRGEDGEARAGVAILTTIASTDVRFLHDRMPVMMHPDHYRDWMNPDASLEQLQRLMQSTPPGLLRVFPVSNRVNHVAENDADLILPIAPKGAAGSDE